MSNCLIIFAKNLELGKVKTRLAKDIGNEAAYKVYESLIEHTHAVTKNLNCKKYLFYSERLEENDQWEGNYIKHVQQGEDLGSKMKHAFEQVFEAHKNIVIIGSDCFELSANEILNAFEALENSDFTIGPAKDGGYYLLGMNAPHFYVFENIQYSHADVAKHTIEKIRSNKHSVSLLKELSDVDTIADLDNYPQLAKLAKV